MLIQRHFQRHSKSATSSWPYKGTCREVDNIYQATCNTAVDREVTDKRLFLSKKIAILLHENIYCGALWKRLWDASKDRDFPKSNLGQKILTFSKFKNDQNFPKWYITFLNSWFDIFGEKFMKIGPEIAKLHLIVCIHIFMQIFMSNCQSQYNYVTTLHWYWYQVN